MTEFNDQFHFDTSSGRVLAPAEMYELAKARQGPPNLVELLELGRLALLPNTAELMNERTVVLKDLLLGSLPSSLDNEQFKPISETNWAAKDHEGYVKWLDEITKDDPPKNQSRMSWQVVRQAYGLRIGPSPEHLLQGAEHRSLPELFKAIGIETIATLKERNKVLWGSWSVEDFADYTEQVLKDLLVSEAASGQSANLTKEIARRARAGSGPPPSMFRRDGLGVQKILSLRGYPEVKQMAHEDLIMLGVRIKEVNGGRMPRLEGFDYLSAKRRAPYSSTLLRNYKWREFLAEVDQASVRPSRWILRQRADVIRQEIKEGLVPRELLAGIQLAQVLPRRARWLLLSNCMPGLPYQEQRIMAGGLTPNTLKRVILIRTGAPKWDIEATALRLGIYRDLWPEPTKDLQYLRVPKKHLY